MNLKTGGTMKRIQFLSFILVCVLLCSTVFNTVSLAASTLDTVEHESDYECEEEKKAITISQNQTLEYDDANLDYDIRRAIDETLGNVSLRSSEYLYNLDGSPDYIYVEFEQGGYAVLLKQTMELLEYSYAGKPEYDADAKKYYGGPNLYFQKINGKFIDAHLKNPIEISAELAATYAQSVRDVFLDSSKATYNENVKFDYSTNENYLIKQMNTGIASNPKTMSSIPKADDNPYIKNLPVSDGTYISNYQYFILNPTHGTNSTGSCSAVATQLLMSYHNYYSDRRIIANENLNGSNTPSLMNRNPNYCEDPMSMTSYTLGSRGTREDGSDDANSYFAMVLDAVPKGSATAGIKSGINTLLTNRNAQIANDISYTLGSEAGRYVSEGVWTAVDTSGIVDEIDNGRPVIVIMTKNLSGLNHSVIAYGYQDYTYPGTSNTYSGFITHFGWNSNYLNVWVNSAWCYSYVTLEINHTHSHTTYIGSIGNTDKTEYKCSVCGHRTAKEIDVIEVASRDRYTERVVNLAPYTVKDYYVSFEVGGSKIIQAFGTKDTVIEVYDADGVYVDSDDDHGVGNNAFLRKELQANTQYRIRVYFWPESQSGSTKLVITPTQWLIKSGSTSIETIDDIWLVENRSSYALNTSLALNNTKVFRFVAPSTGTYTFETTGDYDSYLYVVDPQSDTLIGSSDYNDDGGEGQNALLSKALTAGKTYLVFYSAFNIQNQSSTGSIQFRISKE